MNKKIIFPLVAVIVAISAGILSMDYVNSQYNPFDDPKYAGTSAQTISQSYNNYNGSKTSNTERTIYPDYTLKEIVDKSKIIVTGTIKKAEPIESKVLEGDDLIQVHTIYTVVIHDSLKGDAPNEIRYISQGGESENHISITDGFVFEERDMVFLMLSDYETDVYGTLYTPITLDGEYKVTNGGPNSGEVHRYGEDTTVPLPEFKQLVRSLTD